MNSEQPEIDYRNQHIKSFARRRGHFSKAQERAVEQGMPVWGTAYNATQQIDFEKLFGRTAPNWLEIGFGMGETTAKIAMAQAHVNYLGAEIYPAGVGALLQRINENNIKNIRIISHDVVEVSRHDSRFKLRPCAGVFSRPLAQGTPPQTQTDPARICRSPCPKNEARCHSSLRHRLGKLRPAHAASAQPSLRI